MYRLICLHVVARPFILSHSYYPNQSVYHKVLDALKDFEGEYGYV